MSPRAYIFQRPFLRGLYSEGLIIIYGGKFAFQNLLGEPYSWKEIYLFLLCFTLYLRATAKYNPRGGGGGLYLEARFNGGFFTLQVWGAYIWRRLHTKGLIFRKFMVFLLAQCKKIIKKCGPKEAKSTSLFSRTKIILVHFCGFNYL